MQRGLGGEGVAGVDVGRAEGEQGGERGVGRVGGGLLGDGEVQCAEPGGGGGGEVGVRGEQGDEGRVTARDGFVQARVARWGADVGVGAVGEEEGDEVGVGVVAGDGGVEEGVRGGGGLRVDADARGGEEFFGDLGRV